MFARHMNAQAAPDFTLEHIAGNQVSLSDYRGRPVVVGLSGRNSADQMAAGIKAVRARYDSEQLPILAVADLGGIPRPARVIAKRQLKSAYNDAVEEASADLQAAGKPVPPAPDLVVMLPDWEGTVASSFGVGDVEDEYSMVLVDGDGNVRAQGRGTQAPEQILAKLG
jgi:hypothetical protein